MSSLFYVVKRAYKYIIAYSCGNLLALQHAPMMLYLKTHSYILVYMFIVICIAPPIWICTKQMKSNNGESRCVDVLLDKYMEMIIDRRNEILFTSHEEFQCNNSAETILGTSDDYLETIARKLRGSRAVFMEGSPICATSSSYVTGSNNCYLMREGQMYARFRSIPCSESHMHETFHLLKQSDISPNLPDQKVTQERTLNLSYIHIIQNVVVDPNGDVLNQQFRIIPNIP